MGTDAVLRRQAAGFYPLGWRHPDSNQPVPPLVPFNWRRMGWSGFYAGRAAAGEEWARRRMGGDWVAGHLELSSTHLMFTPNWFWRKLQDQPPIIVDLAEVQGVEIVPTFIRHVIVIRHGAAETRIRVNGGTNKLASAIAQTTATRPNS